MRVTISAYFTTEDEKAAWNAVKSHYAGEGDSAVIRQLVREKAQLIASGNTKRQQLCTLVEGDERIEREIAQMKETIVAMQKSIAALTAMVTALRNGM